ncbi:MAG: histidine phosphatase family protein [Nitrospira sp.]|nr:histidine phosphatase family protein [Nitrospira sp.]MDH4303852.1 histidine phosphatase family protein [Nitrospira sp.]
MSESRQELWLIRQGETEWSAAKRHTGRTDVPLTPRGERQATALGRVLADREFTSVLCSPLRRARQTCELAGYGAVATVADGLLEWDYGIYEGRTTEDMRQEEPGWSIWSTSVPKGESLEQVAQRAHGVIAQALLAKGDVLLFAHAHILRILTACWLGLPPPAGRLFVLRTASISVLGYERETRVITQWNVSHEMKDGSSF